MQVKDIINFIKEPHQYIEIDGDRRYVKDFMNDEEFLELHIASIEVNYECDPCYDEFGRGSTIIDTILVINTIENEEWQKEHNKK